MQEILFKGLLQKDIYNKYAGKIPDTLFEDHYGVLYKTLLRARKQLDGNLSDTDFRILFNTYNPALTVAQREAFDQLFNKLAQVQSPSVEATDHVFSKLLSQEKVRHLATNAVDYLNGDEEALEKLMEAYAKLEVGEIQSNQIKEVDHELSELIKYGQNKGSYKINVTSLAELLPGIDPATLTAIFARPETGKTALWITFVAGPDGFCSQGLKVLVVGNEEPVIRTQLRIVNAASGLSLDALLQGGGAFEHAHKTYSAVKKNLKLYDAVGLKMGDLDYLVKKEKPQILIVDTLDKISVGGAFARDDLRIKELYVQARELAKRNNVALIATSQASAEAEDRKLLTLDMMENSRTGKAAECDVIMGVGKMLQGEPNTPIRHIYLCKNKLTGIHDIATVKLNHLLSLYEA